MTIFPQLDLSSGGFLIWILVGYGLGSVPFGLILARLMGLGNLRSIGSGNIGATNVLRTGNKIAAALTLLLDGGKGAIAVLIAQSLSGEIAAQITALAAMLGHCYPVWIKFRGGKGVATFLGVMLALSPLIGVACCATWLLTAILKHISSLSALLAAAASVLWSIIFAQHSLIGLCLLL
ncbi:MAG: glycerol-3-phosphate 1-O-acyltransferase PlsY, partial [Paracoccaceae bacterium]